MALRYTRYTISRYVTRRITVRCALPLCVHVRTLTRLTLTAKAHSCSQLTALSFHNAAGTRPQGAEEGLLPACLPALQTIRSRQAADRTADRHAMPPLLQPSCSPGGRETRGGRREEANKVRSEEVHWPVDL
jgi:hypothetical protein